MSEGNRANCFLRPMPGRIIVQRDGFKYSGKILIPETAKRYGQTGKIIAVGEGIENSLLKVGARVVWPLYGGTELQFAGRPWYMVLSQEEILAVVEGEMVLEQTTGI